MYFPPYAVSICVINNKTGKYISTMDMVIFEDRVDIMKHFIATCAVHTELPKHIVAATLQDIYSVHPEFKTLQLQKDYDVSAQYALLLDEYDWLDEEVMQGDFPNSPADQPEVPVIPLDVIQDVLNKVNDEHSHPPRR